MMRLAEMAIDKALKLNATEAEAYVQKTQMTMIEYTEQIETFKTIKSMGMGLRVALGKRTAMYSTSVLNEREVIEAAEKAVKIAKVAPEDPCWKHFNRKFGKTPVEGTYDPKVEKIEHEEIVETLLTSISLLKKRDSRVKPTRGILVLATSDVAVADSNHEQNEGKQTGVSVQFTAKIAESGMESTGSEHQESRFWKEIDFNNVATKAADKAVKFLNSRSMKGGKMQIIFKNQIFANLLGIFIGPAISADWVQKGRSPLIGKVGTNIASENVTITDDGTLPGGWGTSSFDDEGYPTQRTSIIEKGTLRNYIYDTYTALKANAESTGNAQRPGYWLKPQPSPSNLVFKNGDEKTEEMIKDMKAGIYVDTTIGEWLSNPVSGNLNATITHGYLVEKGELTKPVKGLVISGNFFDLLKTGIKRIGNDLKNSGEDYSPTVEITGLTVAGE